MAMNTILFSIRNGVFFALARYFGFWADIVLRRWRPLTIVVTGSSGKTTLQHMLAYQFGSKAAVSGKYNSTFGIPFHILDVEGTESNKLRWFWLILIAPVKAFTVKRTQRYYIAEADASMPGEGKFLAKLLKPHATLWVSSARTHSKYFDRLVKKGDFPNVDEAIAAEFAHFGLHTKRLLIADGDNHDVSEAIEEVAPNLHFDSKEVALKNYTVDPKKTAFMLTNKRIYRFAQPQPEQIGYQVVMMDKLLTALRIEPKTDMADMKLPPGRSTVLRGVSATTILDSSYNANLDSMETVLDLFAKLRGTRNILVLGDMLEQGVSAATEHRKLAHRIADLDIPLMQVVLLGPLTERYTKPLLEKLIDAPVHSCSTTRKVLDHLEETIQGREFILFKGSQGQMLEGAIEKLLANKEDAKLLPRRSKLWKRRRAEKGLQ